MIRLRTFGGLQLEAAGAPVGGAASQRRRLALLALLAASERGLSRESLLGFLWPETEEERGRHALSQLLYSVRRDLGEGVVRADGAVLRVDADLLPSDVAQFRAAIGAGDSAAAVALYGGSFLDGFYLTGCEAFERWTEETRSELAASAHAALWAVATMASGRRDHGEATRALQRLARLTPLDARVTLALMQSLAAEGNVAGALDHARVYAALVRDELGTPPDPTVSALEATLRARLSSAEPPLASEATPPIERSAAPTSRAESLAPSLYEEGAAHVARESRESRDSDPVAGRRNLAPVPRRDRRLLAVAAALAVVVVIAVAWRRASESGTTPPPSVVIADVENHTADSVFDRSVPVALAASLAQSEQMHVLSPDRVRATLGRMRRAAVDSILHVAVAREVAQREGVPAVIVPSVERAGQGYDLAVRVIDAADGTVRTFVGVHAERRDVVIEQLDALVAKLRRALGEPRRAVASAEPLPRVTTASLDALKQFAEGARAFNLHRYADAEARWRDAVAIDSQFALAEAALGKLAYWVNRTTDGERHYTRALALAGELPERERVRLKADFERARGNFEKAAEILRPYVAAHPNERELTFALGYANMRLDRDDEAAATFRRLVAADSLDHSAFINLAVAEKGLERFPAAIAAYRRAFAIVPELETANNNTNLEFAGTFVLNGDLDSAAAVFDKLLNAGDAARRARALRSFAYLDMWRGDFASAARRLSESSAIHRRDAQGLSEVRDLLLLASAHEATGSEHEARRALQRASAVIGTIPPEPTAIYWCGKALARAGMLADADRVLALLERSAKPDVRTHRAALAALRGELSVARGRATAGVDKLRAAAGEDSTSHVLESLAFGLAAADSLDAALTQYARLAARREFGWEGQLLSRPSPWHLGRLREKRGDVAGAIESYRQLTDRFASDDGQYVLLADAHQRVARLGNSEPPPAAARVKPF